MATFPDFIRQNLERSGYRTTQQFAHDIFMRTPADERVWIAYLDTELPPEQIRRAFEYQGHVLFVVDDKLIPQDIKDRKSTPMWLRVLHGLYMGRIYTWNGRFLYGLHFDYDTGDISESPAIQPDELWLIETGTWLKGWSDQYRLARFYDRVWWNEAKQDFTGQQTDDNFRRQHENQWYKGRQEYNKQRQNKQSYGYYGGTGSNPPPNQNATGGRDFGKEFRACDSLMEIKALYRKLAREYHPDLNPGKDTTAIMQQINAAYDRAKMVYA